MDIAEARKVVPRPAATVLILRDGADGIEVLMVKRSPNASFMPNAFVFPGGGVDAADAAVPSDETDQALNERLGRAFSLKPGQARAFSIATLRECLEECGLWLGVDTLDADVEQMRKELASGVTIGEIAARHKLPVATSALHPWSRWVTPFTRPKRFDTVFFLCKAPSGQTPEVDAGETTTLQWVDPDVALSEQKAGKFQMEFATRAIVRSLLPHSAGTVDQLLAHADTLTNLAAVHPRLRLAPDGKVVGVLLPGEEGYADLPADEHPI